MCSGRLPARGGGNDGIHDNDGTRSARLATMRHAIAVLFLAAGCASASAPAPVDEPTSELAPVDAGADSPTDALRDATGGPLGAVFDAGCNPSCYLGKTPGALPGYPDTSCLTIVNSHPCGNPCPGRPRFMGGIVQEGPASVPCLP
jgi:hypothetical protein